MPVKKEKKTGNSCKKNCGEGNARPSPEMRKMGHRTGYGRRTQMPPKQVERDTVVVHGPDAIDVREFLPNHSRPPV